jgi:GAF domain-containing protein/anti-sigma regulatory factor (Ser/Thr protein kinase)
VFPVSYTPGSSGGRQASARAPYDPLAVTPSEMIEPREAPLRDPGLVGLPSDRLLDELLRRLAGVMNADVAQFLLVEGDHLRVLATFGVPLEQVRDLRIPVGRGFAGTVAATGSPAALADTSTLETFGASWAEEGVRALVGVPLVVGGRTLGVCVVGSRVERRFSDSDIELLTAATERAAWAVENGLLLAAEQQARTTAESVGERLRRLETMSRELVSALSADEVVRVLVERGLSLLGAMAGSFWEPEPEAGVLRLRGVVGYPDEVVSRWFDLSLDADAPAAEAARTGRQVVLRSVAERDARYPSLAGRASAGDAFVCAPLVVDERLVGVLGLGFERADVLDGDGLAFLDAAVAQCAAAMHRALVVQAQQRSLAAARASADRLASLQRLTAALADARDAATMVDLIVHELTSALGAVRVMLSLLDASGQTLRTARAYGVQPRFADEYAEFPLRPGLPAADALLTGQVVVLHDVAERNARYPDLEVMDDDEHALVCLPLVVASRPIGSLALSFPGAPSFEDADLQFLAALGDQCAHALDRARLVGIERENRERLELLAEAGRIFSAPLDVQLTSLQFSRLVVGRIGDAVSVHLRQPDGSYALAAAEHVDVRQARAARLLSADLPDMVRVGYDHVLDNGEAILTTEIPTELFLAAVADRELRETLAEQPVRSNILLPLVAGGHALGVLSVSTVEGGHDTLTADDVERLEELAGRLALALDGARLLRLQTEIAHTLQRSLLPSALPHVPGAEVAVRYLPGAEGVDVGGDFYDVIPLPSGRIGLVVGDVMGRGVRAAAVMGQLRAAVRAYSLEGHPPAALLARLDRLVGTLEEGLLVTALYAEWDPGRDTVVCASAGHLPPLVRLPGAEPSFLDVEPGVPLGVGVQSYAEADLTLPAGSLWLAFTDGLVEGPDLPVEQGMARLARAVRSSRNAMDACDDALRELRPLGDSRRYDDDTALLALVTHPTAGGIAPAPATDSNLVTELPADLSSPGRARAFVASLLEGWGLDVLTDTAMLLTSELVTNGVRHAGTGMRLAVSRNGEWRVRIAVTDHAPTVGVRVGLSDEDAEGGRGLFLVEHMSSGWGSVADDAGKTVWFELQV